MNARTWKTTGILVSSLAVVAFAALAGAAGSKQRLKVAVGPVTVKPSEKPKAPVVEVVFALDTTGSMSGLIEGAKQKVWHIANAIASGQPTPITRIGLVAYRDRGDEYVTKLFPLTDDLDAMYGNLMGLQAGGGGDFPEDVNKALADAIHGSQWSEGSMKLIFLVGDAPPHMDYGEATYQQLMEDAKKKGIVVHTVRCGADGTTQEVFQAIASANQGSYTSIDGSGGMVAVATPYDGRLAELSRELDDTTLIYGDPGDHARMDRKKGMNAAAAPEAASSRASFYGKAKNKIDGKDILEEAATGAADLGDMDKTKLPTKMQTMSAPEQKAYAKEQYARRQKVTQEIAELSKKRDAHVKAEMAKQGEGGFDAVVTGAVAKQAADHGLKY